MTIVDAEIVEPDPNERCNNCGGLHPTMHHIEALPVVNEAPSFTPGRLEPQAHGGALQRGGHVHGLGFRRQVTPEIQARAAEVREQLSREYGPEIEQLDLPTVELFCIAMARAIGWSNHIGEYTEGNRTRTVKGKTFRGYEAVPAYMWAEEMRANKAAAEHAQALGMDLIGRVKALKDDAISRSLNGGGGLKDLSGQGRKLRQLRGRSS